MFGIPVPKYALVIREVPYQQLDYFNEEEDFVEVHGMRFYKPFVEKPVDGKLFSCVGETLYFASVSYISFLFLTKSLMNGIYIVLACFIMDLRGCSFCPIFFCEALLHVVYIEGVFFCPFFFYRGVTDIRNLHWLVLSR